MAELGLQSHAVFVFTTLTFGFVGAAFAIYNTQKSRLARYVYEK